MGYLVMIEKAMNSHNPLSLSMLESYWGALSPNCNQQGNTMLLDSTILSCCLFLCIFWKVTKSVFENWYDKRKSSFTDKGVRMTFLGKII